MNGAAVDAGSGGGDALPRHAARTGARAAPRSGVRGLVDRWFFRRVDAASLAVFRIGFGALMLFEAVNYGFFLCLDCMYRETDFLFKYSGFEWVRLPPGIGLELGFVAMALGAAGVMLGLFFRASALLLLATFSYLFLLDQALYLNHFYLAILYLAILACTPANRLWSLDARRRPEIASATIPNWPRFWLGAQTEIVLLYAGIVKLNADWLQLEPMRLWMNYRSADAAPLFQWLTQDWGIAAASYGAIALHLVGAPLLLWRRTRLPVLGVYAFFHLTNAFTFNIGIFPFMTFAATLMLFDANWPRQFARWLRARLGLAPRANAGEAAVATAAADAPVDRAPDRPPGRLARTLDAVAREPRIEADAAAAGSSAAGGPSSPVRAFVVAGVLGWLVLQCVVPLRHLAAPGDVAWNEDGHRFSWRMKLRSKVGRASFVVVHPDGTREVVDPADHLNRKQVRKMACIPDLVWQFAQFVETDYRRAPDEDVAVHAWTSCSLNTREPIALVRRQVDLTAIDRDTPTQEWLMPNRKPLPQRVF